MRTEQLLRDTLADVAATARTPETALPRILAGLPTPASTAIRNRRRVLVAALAAVLLIAAVAVPGLMRRGTAEPADTRAPGNWNLIHRVDLPPGWQTGTRAVTATSESSNYSTTGDGTAGGICSVEVLAAGQNLAFPATTASTVLVDVNGHPASYRIGADEQTPQLSWQYAEDSLVGVTCEPAAPDEPAVVLAQSKALELDFARRLVFEPTPLRMPFELESMPAGYEIHDVAQSENDPLGGVGVQFRALVADDAHPPLTITANSGTTEVKPGIPGQETTVVDGQPAVLSATEGRLCLNVRSSTVCITAEGGEPADLNVSLWPAGRRELLVDIASHLTVVKNLEDPTTWPDANEALPR